MHYSKQDIFFKKWRVVFFLLFLAFPLFLFSEKGNIDESIIDAKSRQTLPKRKSTETTDFIPREYTLAIRANLLHWVTLTPDLGLEYRNRGLTNYHLGLLVNAAATKVSIQNIKFSFWKINPEARYYLGRGNGYLGLAFTYLDYNVAKAQQGYTGDIYAFSLTGGYKLRLDKKSNFYLDFNIGLGYANMLVQKYRVLSSMKIQNIGNPYINNYIGCTQLGISLVWAILKEKL